MKFDSIGMDHFGRLFGYRDGEETLIIDRDLMRNITVKGGIVIKKRTQYWLVPDTKQNRVLQVAQELEKVV